MRLSESASGGDLTLSSLYLTVPQEHEDRTSRTEQGNHSILVKVSRDLVHP